MPKSKSGFRLNPMFESEFLRSAAAREVLEKDIEPVVKRVKSLAPKLTGQLVSKIHGEVAIVGGRLVGRIISADWKSAIIIKGSSRNRPNPFLRSGVEAEGYRIEKFE